MTLDRGPDVRIADTRYGQLRYIAGDDPIGVSLERYGEWAQCEISLLLSLLRPGDTAIDVGANVGTHAIAMAERVGLAGRVIAFEPQSVLCELLSLNATAGARNIDVRHAAIGARYEQLYVQPVDYSGHVNTGAVRLSAGDPRSADAVEVFPLDSLDLTTCRLVKIDVEGMEDEVLTGMSTTIERCEPILAVECNGLDDGLAILLSRDWSRYEAYLVRSGVFNPSNYRNEPINIFGPAQETLILFVPATEGQLPEPPPGVGLIPVRDLRTLALALIETPRHGDTSGSPDLGYRLAEVESTLTDVSRRAERAERDLREARAELEVVYSSASWRITRPFRALRSRARRLLTPARQGKRRRS